MADEPTLAPEGAPRAGPAVAGAPKLARRARELVDLAKSMGFSHVRVRVLRDRRVQAVAAPGGQPAVNRATVRRVDAVLQLQGRQLRLRTTNLDRTHVEEKLQEAHKRLSTGAKELLAPASSTSRGAPPSGPFDALQVADAALSPADAGAVRGLALALSNPAKARVTITADAHSEAVARSDGARVAWHHTRLHVDMAGAGARLECSVRTLAALPKAGRLVDRFQARQALMVEEHVPGPARRTRLLTHPEAGAALVLALARLPLRTARLADRLSVVVDPWVVGGLEARPFDAAGQATRPVVLIEGGLQRRRLQDTDVGDVRVGLGGKSLPRLLGETDEGVLVAGWHRVQVDPDSGHMRLHGRGWTLRDGARADRKALIVVEGRLPELFRQLVAVGADPWTFGPGRTPTLVFDDVMVAV